MSEIRVKALPRCFGYFDGFEVSGIPYEDSSGHRRGWQVHVNPDGHNEFRDYWLQHYWVSETGEFHEFGLHFENEDEVFLRIPTGVKEPTPQERKAILLAIGKWEQ
jgi:hypothetical protein